MVHVHYTHLRLWPIHFSQTVDHRKCVAYNFAWLMNQFITFNVQFSIQRDGRDAACRAGSAAAAQTFVVKI